MTCGASVTTWMFPHAFGADEDLKSFCHTSSPSSESTAYKVFASARRARSLNPRPVIRPGNSSGSLNEDDFAGSFPSLSFHRNLKSLATVSVVISVSAFCALLWAASASGAFQKPRGGPCARAKPDNKSAPAKQGAARSLRVLIPVVIPDQNSKLCRRRCQRSRGRRQRRCPPGGE